MIYELKLCSSTRRFFSWNFTSNWVFIDLLAFYSLHVSYTFEIISLYAVLKNVKPAKGKYFLKLNHPLPSESLNEMNLKGKRNRFIFTFLPFSLPHHTRTCLTGVWKNWEANRNHWRLYMHHLSQIKHPWEGKKAIEGKFKAFRRGNRDEAKKNIK
jgi:hypothetical protein